MKEHAPIYIFFGLLVLVAIVWLSSNLVGIFAGAGVDLM
jgi:hypothetical protein